MGYIQNIPRALLLVIIPAAAIQIWPSSSDIPNAVPLSCRQALASNITCANSLVRAQDVINGAALPKEQAELYCTAECQKSLDNFRHNVNSTCGEKEYVLNHHATVKQYPLALADGLIWAYNVSCIRDSTGFCFADLQNHTKEACSDCTLKYGAVMMSSDYGRKQFPPAAYSSLLSSCSVPASSYPYSYTAIPTATNTSATGTNTVPSATPTSCAGTSYLVKDGDTCESISHAKSVGTDRMIQRNYLDYHCSSLAPGAELCIEDTCTVYTVQANDTCQGIVQSQSFGLVQLVGWNPTLHDNCDNLDSMLGRSLCVSPPGGNGSFVPPAPHNTTSQGLSTSLISSWVPGETVTTLTNITTSWYTPTIDPDYTPPGVTHTPNATYSSLFAERTAYCWITEDDYNNEDFSPYDLEEDCLSLFEEYCEPAITSPIPTSTSIPGSCTPTFTTYTSTPETNATTSTTTSTTIAPTPTPTQPNMVKGCTKFHQVQSKDECDTIASQYKISVNDFYDWNPDIGDNCKALWLDYYVCVGGPSSNSTTTTTKTASATTTKTTSVTTTKITSATTTKTTATTTTTTTSTTTSGVATPTPTQANMVKNCTKFHKVGSKDQCSVIASENNISLADFYTWNPDVGDKCGALWLDYYVCVGTS
ncbi:hypothetical protein BJX76DRAFT_358502 [Aspergillus varians]